MALQLAFLPAWLAFLPAWLAFFSVFLRLIYSCWKKGWKKPTNDRKGGKHILSNGLSYTEWVLFLFFYIIKAPRQRTSVWCGLVAGERLCNVMLRKRASWEHISFQLRMFRGQGPPACADETYYSLGQRMKPSLISAHPTVMAVWNHLSCNSDLVEPFVNVTWFFFSFLGVLDRSKWIAPVSLPA